MRIDLPLCNLKTCRYSFDGNCTDKIKYEQCEYTLAKEERPHGEWIFSGVEHTADNPIDSDSYYCSICKRSISTSLTRPEELFPFCHCGADMRKER